jgi:hypothetical protein
MKIETLLAQAAQAHDPTGGVIPAIHPSVTFARDEENRLLDGRMYLRHDSVNGGAPKIGGGS